MSKENFKNILKEELKRVDELGISKRNEIIIEDFSFEEGYAPKAIIKGKKYSIFNSNDYLGLRLNKKVIEAEHNASNKYGSGPGAVRFISGSMLIHKELEKEVAKFHDREDCIIFSSAFATNFGVLHSLIKGQSRDSLINKDTLVISDELNHRSIIDGIRVAGLSKENKSIFKHQNFNDLKNILETNKGKFKRVLVITDGIFSMLGNYQDLSKINEVIDEYENEFEEGIILIVDDAHGVGAFGNSGRGVEEYCNSKSDILIGTFGKGFGVDGGYVVGDKIYIDYLRESAATYIYSNPISPGTAGAALKSIQLVNSDEGKELLKKLNDNISYFKEKIKNSKFELASQSVHAIQPILIGDPIKTRKIVDELYNKGILVTN
ncbi:MAG: aminotransferase class I/II-fold pyridoxal phosphate-dependent enzyme, partial [Candidatus Woesearchaeota archaeon]